MLESRDVRADGVMFDCVAGPASAAGEHHAAEGLRVQLRQRIRRDDRQAGRGAQGHGRHRAGAARGAARRRARDW